MSDSDTVAEAVGKVTEALETVERARGHLYSFHQLTGRADLQLDDAVARLEELGHTELAEHITTELVGRNVLPGRWTFQVVEDYDDGYYRCFQEVERLVRMRLTDGRRHAFEASLKERRRTRGNPAHAASPGDGSEFMRCVVFGATGYLGTRLIPQLLSAGHTVRVLARNPAKLDDVVWRGDVGVVRGDVVDADAVRQALEGQDVLYYLVHSLMRPDFVEFDHRAACTVAEAAAGTGLSRIVYVGGIIPEGQRLSDHLASRAQVGEVFMESGLPTVELRAAVIIGAGSASFEMLRYLTERLPLIVTPPWLHTRVQPIAVRDVLYYLVKAAELSAAVNRPFDIGGPDRFPYTEMIRKYAAVAGLPRRPALPVPLLSPRLSAPWVDLLTPLPRQLAVSLMESLENDVVCADRDIARHIPDPDGGLTHYEEAVELALSHVRESDLRTRWTRGDTNGAPSGPLPTDPQWAGGPMYDDVRERPSRSDPATLWRAIETAATERNWSAFPLGWPLRGWVNGLLSAVWTRRGTLDGHRPHIGEALDWWRVERVDAPRLLRLRADIPLPGRLWLELSAGPDGNGGSVYRQRALFQPYGLAGQLFWSASGPSRDAIFGGIARDVVATARRAQPTEPIPSIER